MGIQVSELTSGKHPWEKEFIDFEFDGKNVSDFGLVVVSDGDRLSLDFSAPFTDETSEVNGVDGQLFWGTKYNARKLQYKLATDGMTPQQVSAFKQHFRPGKYGKLFDTYEFGKYSWARVTEPPVFSYIPFQNQVSVGANSFKSDIFKGEVTITFICDDPLKYGEYSAIDKVNEETIRLMVHEGVPLGNDDHWKLDFPCHLANGDKIGIDDNSGTHFLFYNPSEAPTAAKLTLKVPFSTTLKNGLYYINSFRDDIVYEGEDKPYCRVMQSIKIKIEKTKDEDGNIITQKPSIGFDENEALFDINTAKEIFRFTSPYVYYSANKIIDILKDYKDKEIAGAAVEFEERLREEVHDFNLVTWTIRGLTNMMGEEEERLIKYHNKDDNYYNVSASLIDIKYNSSGWVPALNLWILRYFSEGVKVIIDENDQKSYEDYGWELNEWNDVIPDSILTIDSSTGEITIKYSCNSKWDIAEVGSNQYKPIFTTLEKSCGDISLSKHLKLDGGNELDSDGDIATYYQLGILKGNTYDNDKLIPTALEYKYTYL